MLYYGRVSTLGKGTTEAYCREVFLKFVPLRLTLLLSDLFDKLFGGTLPNPIKDDGHVPVKGSACFLDVLEDCYLVCHKCQRYVVYMSFNLLILKAMSIMSIFISLCIL